MERNLPNKIDNLVNEINERQFNGSLLLAQGEKVIYERAKGSYGQPTLFNQFLVGSVSKQFTSTLLLQLASQKLIDIDRPIKKYLPDLLDEWAEIVTVRHLLNHTSGVKKLGEPLEFQPGTKFKYSATFGYYLCSQIAEKVTGCKFEQLLNRLFISANMKHSGVIDHRDFAVAKQKHPLLVQGFKESKDKKVHPVASIEEGEEVYDITWIAGGGIVSTLHDLLQWNLKLHQGKLLDKNSYLQMITRSATREHPRYGTIGYGLGVQLVDHQELEISHSGYMYGFVSTLIYYPKSAVSVIVLENISLSLSDIKRAFSFHDRLRDLIRSEMLCDIRSL